MKSFNTTAICFPDKHYMVDTSDRIRQIIEELVEQNKYFTINRARQYGKTTTLFQLKAVLQKDYYVAKLSFEGLGETAKSEKGFVQNFVDEVYRQLVKTEISRDVLNAWSISFSEDASIVSLSQRITELCDSSDREIILMIDEVDAISDNELFLSFLGMLRKKYISASEGEDVTFKSVILAGVYDIKDVQKRPLNAKRFFDCGRDLPPSSDEGALPLKMRPDEEHQYNSPWNVTADFDVDMSFHSEEIAVMLDEYRDDHGFQFDTEWFARQIYDYTSGYPFLVSRICWLIDAKVARLPEFQSKQVAWTQTGFQCAIKLLQREQNTLFDDLNKKLDENSKLKDLVYRIVVCRENVPFNLNDNLIKLGAMFGWFKDLNGMTAISNRIFETIICDKLLQERTTSRIYKVADLEKYQMKTATDLDMDEIIARFARHYKSIYADRTSDFLENEARIIFLTFLKPIINGSGNYYMEPETADKTRVETPPRSAWRQVAPSIGSNAAHLDGAADIIVDYQGHQYIIEAKVWHGENYEQTGREQLAGYLKRYDLPVGWLISFCFNKDKEKLIGTNTVEINGKIIRETVL